MQTCDDVSNSMSVYEERVIIHVCLESLVEPRLFLSPNIIISVIAFLVFVSIIYPLIYLERISINIIHHKPIIQEYISCISISIPFALRHYNLVQYFFSALQTTKNTQNAARLAEQLSQMCSVFPPTTERMSFLPRVRIKQTNMESQK